MKTRVLLATVLVALVSVFIGGELLAQVRTPSQDPFESRRRDQEYRNNLRRQQEQASRRPAVPTFTIPQPAYNNRYYDPRLDPRYDPRAYDPNYVFIPGHYQNVYGRLVYIPPHFEYVPRF